VIVAVNNKANEVIKGKSQVSLYFLVPNQGIRALSNIPF
jgi:hypothetical protein